MQVIHARLRNQVGNLGIKLRIKESWKEYIGILLESRISEGISNFHKNLGIFKGILVSVEISQRFRIMLIIIPCVGPLAETNQQTLLASVRVQAMNYSRPYFSGAAYTTNDNTLL